MISWLQRVRLYDDDTTKHGTSRASPDMHRERDGHNIVGATTSRNTNGKGMGSCARSEDTQTVNKSNKGRSMM